MVKGNKFWDSTQYGTQTKAREIALGAVRSYLRKMDIDPVSVTGEQAYQSLFDLAAIDETTVAGHFARYSSVNQLNLFVKDWNRWQKEQL